MAWRLFGEEMGNTANSLPQNVEWGKIKILTVGQGFRDKCQVSQIVAGILKLSKFLGEHSANMENVIPRQTRIMFVENWGMFRED